MSHIRSTNTKPEETLRKALFAKGFRYRKYVKNLPGKPDIVLKKYNAVIFVNGCFWHKHDACGRFHWPTSNVDYWTQKILSNVQRDQKNYSVLKEQGWNVIVVWECELRKKTLDKTLERISQQLFNAQNEPL